MRANIEISYYYATFLVTFRTRAYIQRTILQPLNFAFPDSLFCICATFLKSTV